MTGRALVAMFALGAVLTGVALWRPERDRPPPAASASAAAGSVPAGGAAKAAPTAPVRAEHAADRPMPPRLANSHELDAFLGTLTDDARRRGEVRVEDERLGMEAIHSLAAQLGPRVAMARSLRFARELDNLKKQLELAPLQRELDALARQIEAQPRGPERDRLAAQYRAKAGPMPELYRIAALDRLIALAPPRSIEQQP